MRHNSNLNEFQKSLISKVGWRGRHKMRISSTNNGINLKGDCGLRNLSCHLVHNVISEPFSFVGNTSFTRGTQENKCLCKRRSTKLLERNNKWGAIQVKNQKYGSLTKAFLSVCLFEHYKISQYLKKMKLNQNTLPWWKAHLVSQGLHPFVLLPSMQQKYFENTLDLLKSVRNLKWSSEELG